MKKKVIVFYPTASSGPPWEWVTTFNQARTFLMNNADQLPFEIDYTEMPVSTFPIDANRNECAIKFLEGVALAGGVVYRADISIWIDTDHTIPMDCLFRLLKHNRPIMLGVYYLKTKYKEQPFYPVLFKKREDAEGLYKAVMEFPDSGIFEVDSAGMGCACIRREVFEKLEMPYFKYDLHPKKSSKPDADWRNEVGICDVSEDMWFWKQVKAKTDYPILVDPQIQLGHVGKLVFEQSMYRAWLKAYKDRLVQEYGQEEHERRWAKVGKAGPYKEVELFDMKGAKVG